MVHIDILSDHEILDSILRHLLKKERKMYDWQTIQEELLTDVSAEMVRTYMTRLIDDEVVNARSQRKTHAGGFFWIEVNDKTELFLTDGGYTKLHKDRLQEIADNDRMAEMKAERDGLELEVLKLQKRELKNKRLYAFMGFISGSIVTIGVALIPYIISHFGQAKQYHPTEQMTTDSPDTETQPLIQSDTIETP